MVERGGRWGSGAAPNRLPHSVYGGEINIAALCRVARYEDYGLHHITEGQTLSLPIYIRQY